jgi:mxaJ protein
MCSRFLKKPFVGIYLLSAMFAGCSGVQPAAVIDKHYIEPPKQLKIPASTTALRVCADPNNLPFSNNKGEGFENRIASLIAGEMDLPVEYTWWAQRRGFFRNTLRAGTCDVVMGVPLSFELAATTRPYYRSTYVFATRHDRALDIASLDDPRLKVLKIGVQMIGDDGTNAPPAHALANRGIIDNVRGFTVYGNYGDSNPTEKIVDAVENRDIDVAVVWGPLGGYFGSGRHAALDIKPVTPEMDLPYLPFVFDISVGVRRGEDDLKAKIDEILVRRHADIEKILDTYHVPRVAPAVAAAKKEGV